MAKHLTNCGLETSHDVIVIGLYCSGNSVLPDGIHAVPDPMLFYHHWGNDDMNREGRTL